MTEPFNMEVLWVELINRGLNKKVPDLKPQIDKILALIITDEVKKRFPKYKFPTAWHFEYIKFWDTTEKYTMTIAPGFPKQKG